MGVLIDASVLIENERGRLDLQRRLSGREDEFFISVVTAGELLHGVHRAVDEAVRARRSAWVEAIIVGFPLLPVDLAAARAHAGIRADLAARGATIGPHDLWLAAQAIAHGLSLATANAREFARVSALVTEEWGNDAI